jgi:hypothetical protein
MVPNQYLTELRKALEEYRFKDVRSLTDKIDLPPLSLPQEARPRKAGNLQVPGFRADLRKISTRRFPH